MLAGQSLRGICPFPFIWHGGWQILKEVDKRQGFLFIRKKFLHKSCSICFHTSSVLWWELKIKGSPRVVIVG